MSGAVAYTAPSIPDTLTLSSFLYLLNVSEHVFTQLLHAGILGPLFLGIIYGPQAANILSTSTQSNFISLGYIGLILIIFEAGLSTEVSLLFNNITLSFCVAVTGVLVPIALSLILLHFGYGYTLLQSFTAGASLCSTSLGTTVSLLDPSLRRTQAGIVLMSAALLDDIAGLVIAAIITHLSSRTAESSSIPWLTIARPVLVSIAFSFGASFLAWLTRYLALIIRKFIPVCLESTTSIGSTQLFVIVIVLSGFVAGAQYASTSELFGAYLAGVFISYVFNPGPIIDGLSSRAHASQQEPQHSDRLTPSLTFATYIHPLLSVFLSPVFFASIGAALPVRTLGSRKVAWRGILYSLLMIFAKAIVGIWIWVWPERGCVLRRRIKETRTQGGPSHSAEEPGGNEKLISAQSSHPALLLGLAMVARGEVALIVAQLGRSLLGDNGQEMGSSEPFAVVTWAILVTTVGGAMGVGLILRWRRTG